MRSRPASLAPDPQGSGKTCPLLLVHKEAEDPDTTRGEGSILLIGWSTPSPWTLDTAEQPLSSSPTASSCAGPTPLPQGSPVPYPAPLQLAGHCIGEAKKGCREGEGGMIWENDQGDRNTQGPGWERGWAAGPRGQVRGVVFAM